MTTEDPDARATAEVLLTAVTARLGERNLRLNEDAEAQLSELATRAAATLAEENRIGDPAAVAKARSSFDRLVEEIVSRQPEARRGAAPPPVTGGRVVKAVESLCPGFWPFC